MPLMIHICICNNELSLPHILFSSITGLFMRIFTSATVPNASNACHTNSIEPHLQAAAAVGR